MPIASLRTKLLRSTPVLAVLAAAGIALGQGGCASIAVAVAPEKKAEVDDTPEFHAAESAFWGALHGGDYTRIGDTLELYQRAYSKNPNAPMTAARIGWLHTWRIAERTRHPTAAATITDDIVLARKYFGEAAHLAPNESRFLGFLASVTMAEGAIHKDEATIRRGYFLMNDAVDAWPEFNYFTAGISVANLPASDPLFDPVGYHQEAVWPLYTGWVSLAEWRAGRGVAALAHLRANAGLAEERARGAFDEVLHGTERLAAAA